MKGAIPDRDLFPEWFNEVLELDSRGREAFIQDCLDEISRSGSIDDRPTEDGQALVKFLKQDCDFVGFNPNLVYARGKGADKDMRVKFVHKFGYPTLVYKHRKMPILISANPALVKDQMFLAKIPGNARIFDGVYVVGVIG
jgi:hypothetical protein